MESMERVLTLTLINAQITAMNFFLVFQELYSYICHNVDIIIYEIFILHLCIILIEY